ncbi:MAG: MerR family transcriptional regulator [Vulcanibacillus sp.]
MRYKVKEVADIVGISVRTLHHYDQIGLLKPESITNSGYRLYSDNDLERLQQILFLKELEFSLHKIKNILDSPNFNRQDALKIQKILLIEKKERLTKVIGSIDKTLESIEGGLKMSKKEMFEAFDMTILEEHQKEYANEVKQKYGESVAYKESQNKTSKYAKDDWSRIMEDAGKIYDDITNLMDKGPSDPQVQNAIELWRKHINDNFYTCTLEIFRGLGDLYVDDERFTKNIDKYRIGLAEFMREAMHIYCDNQER